MKKIIWAIVIISLIGFCGCTETGQQSITSSDVPTAAVSTSGTSEPAAGTKPEATDSNPETVTDTGTSETGAGSTPIIVNELTDDGEGTFYIGQPRNDIKAILKNRGIEIQDDVDITISTEKFGFEFDNKNELLVNVILKAASETPTVSGLDFGDSYEKMTELYGSDYMEKVLGPEASTYIYEIGNHYFYVRIYQGGVNMWGIRIDYTMEGSPY